MEKLHGHTSDYWKNNAEEDYLKVPTSVLKYITCLEEQVEKLNSTDIRSQEEITNDIIKDHIANRFGYTNWNEINTIEFEREDIRKEHKRLMENCFVDYLKLITTIKKSGLI